MIKNFLLSLIMLTISISAFATEFISMKAFKGSSTVEQIYMINMQTIDSIYPQKTSGRNPYELVFNGKDTYFVRFFTESERNKFLDALKKHVIIKDVK